VIAEWSVAIPIAIACVALAAFCAGTEVALLSIRRVERDQLARSPRFTERRIAALLEKPRRLIATVLVGNEACAGLLAVLAFGVASRAFTPWPAFWLALAAALPLIVLVSEITAKTLAAKAPLVWARLCALPLAAFAVVVAPARLIVEAAAGLVLAPFGGASRARPPGDLSEAEFRTLVDAGSAQGEVDARERRLIHRVFEFHDKNVGQVMTPRERIFALSYDLPAQRLVRELAARGFSRVPIYQKSLDNIRGILNAKDLVRTTAGQTLGRPLGELLHEPLFVPRTTPVKRLFLTFKQKKVHMAIVVSEYGKVLGLVTMDDLLAQIFGVLRDERAELQSSIVPPRAPARTPPEGKPEVGAPGDGAVPAALAADDGLVHRGDDRSGPAVLPDGTLVAAAVLDPPPPRPIHDVDEVTPPAIDLADLLASGRGDPEAR
jgi:putative hemolysin